MSPESLALTLKRRIGAGGAIHTTVEAHILVPGPFEAHSTIQQNEALQVAALALVASVRRVLEQLPDEGARVAAQTREEVERQRRLDQRWRDLSQVRRRLRAARDDRERACKTHLELTLAVSDRPDSNGLVEYLEKSRARRDAADAVYHEAVADYDVACLAFQELGGDLERFEAAERENADTPF